MNVLNLTLKKEWFDKIESGEKHEEYREIKTHWVLRLMEANNQGSRSLSFSFPEWMGHYGSGISAIDRLLQIRAAKFKPYTHILFRNGYSRNSPEMLIELKGITIGKGNPKWGAPDKDVFILQLGEVVERKNLKP